MPDPVTISAISAGISGLSAVIAISSIVVSRLTAQQLKQHDAALDRRRFVTTLWDKMTQVKKIDPAAPIEEDVKFALNTLDLIAVCWINLIVDKEMIVVVFGDNFILRTNEIKLVPKLPLIQRTGMELLQSDYHILLTVESEIQEMLKARRGGVPSNG